MNEADQELELWRAATEVPDAAVAILRSRVMAAVAQPKPRLLPWKWAAAGLVTAGLAGLWVSRPVTESHNQTQREPKPQPAAIATPNPTALPRPALETPLVTVTQRQRNKTTPIRPVAETAQAASYIRMETEDPSVVILLVSGGGE